VVSGTPTYQLWATADIKTLADLKGKSIGIATRGDTTEIATRLLLQSAGVPPDSVGYTPLGFGSSIGAVLTTGALAAAVLPSEARATMEEKGGLKSDHMLVNYSGTVHMPYAGFAMSAKTLYGDPALSRRLMRAIVKGSRYVKAFKAQTVAMLQKQGNGDLHALEAGYDVSLPALTRDLTVPDDLIKSDIAVRAGLLGLTKDQLPPIDKIYDFSFVRSINAELNASRWKPSI
jgi:ABC-type nitrate/sulfonate/bicarbonate transport system substrate-binding protein